MAQKIGLIAGNGRFPFLVAQEIKKSGDEVIAFCLKEETDPFLSKIVNKMIWLHLGEFQKLIDLLHEEQIESVIMAGQVKHSQLFSNLKFDLRAIKLLGKLLNKKTDTILKAIADELAKEGIKLLPSHEYLKDLLPKKGLISGNKLTKEEQKDVDFGFKIAKAIAGLDIGQTVVVKNGAVLAVESIEGTNECIKRAALYGKENAVVVKVAKPNQDFRFDLPVIGLQTIKTLIENKVWVLAIDAGSTLMIDKQELINLANSNGIKIIAL
ncbi:MAG: UDP-2,3-diacylglucosamine diphosphatase LpxI [Elusimicrobia bacterium]|nr:UDP-2,3-diacylglucosamine diphosphatase LpxI [Elusimicrobiota bacterium]